MLPLRYATYSVEKSSRGLDMGRELGRVKEREGEQKGTGPENAI